MDEEDVAFQQKKKAEEAALKAARDKGAILIFYSPQFNTLTTTTAAKGEAEVCIRIRALYLDHFRFTQVALLVVVSRSESALIYPSVRI